MDDYLIYFVLAGILGLITLGLSFLLNKQKKGPSQVEQGNAAQNQRPRAAAAARPDRRAALRNRLNRRNAGKSKIIITVCLV